MSHGRERKQKDCLNCGTIVQGRFCQVCGQENIEPKESFWQLLTHFFYDITHFDGKFFHSLKYIFLRPGFLPKEYMAGRRASYLNPIRMYIFTSAFFFLLFFSFFQPEGEPVITTGRTINNKTIPEIESMDSTGFADFTADLNKSDGRPAVPMSREQFRTYVDSTFKISGIHFTKRRYKTKEQYDSVLASGDRKHNWIMRQLIYKEIELNKKYNNDPNVIVKSLRHGILHSLPQMLFVSLPLLALILKLFYVRRKQFYYISHLLYGIYLYIFVFLAMLVLFGISTLKENFHWSFLKYVSMAIVIAMFFYQYKSLRNFYQQRRGKTLLKFVLINLSLFIVLLILFVLFVFFSLFNI